MECGIATSSVPPEFAAPAWHLVQNPSSTWMPAKLVAPPAFSAFLILAMENLFANQPVKPGSMWHSAHPVSACEPLAQVSAEGFIEWHELQYLSVSVYAAAATTPPMATNSTSSTNPWEIPLLNKTGLLDIRIYPLEFLRTSYA